MPTLDPKWPTTRDGRADNRGRSGMAKVQLIGTDHLTQEGPALIVTVALYRSVAHLEPFRSF